MSAEIPPWLVLGTDGKLNAVGVGGDGTRETGDDCAEETEGRCRIVMGLFWIGRVDLEGFGQTGESFLVELPFSEPLYHFLC